MKRTLLLLAFLISAIYGKSQPDCISDFTYSFNPSGTELILNNESTGNGADLSFFWTFPGGSSTLENPVIEINQSSFEVCLTVLSNNTIDSCMATSCQTIILEGNSCSAAFTVTYSSNEQGHVQFQNTSIGAGPFALSWDFGDGVVSDDGSPSHTYSAPGTYEVCLSINNGSGCEDMVCHNVVINEFFEGSCDASFQSTAGPVNPQNYNFIGNYTSNQSGYHHYWSFGDGTSSEGANPEHHYATPGTYAVCHAVWNTEAACADSICAEVFVASADSGCMALFTPFTGLLNPLHAEFQNTSFTGGVMVTTLWSFGDGTSATTFNAEHTYENAGTYTVCLTIHNAETDCTDDYCTQITVGANTEVCNAAFNISGDVSTGGTIHFTSESENSALSHFWFFSNGITSDAANPTVVLTTGVYTVCHSVFSNANSCVDSLCTVVTIGENPGGGCHAEFTVSGDVSTGGTIHFTSSTENTELNHIWSFGNGISEDGPNPTTILEPGSYTVCHIVFAPNGTCRDTVCAEVVIGGLQEQINIGGQVFAGNNYADQCAVYLYSYDATSNAVELIAETQTDSGYYHFNNIAAGTYLIQAALQEGSQYFSNYIATYFGSQFYWADAEPVVATQNNYNYNISLIYGDNEGGPGTVGGGIDDGDQRLEEGASIPAADATVIVTNMEDQPQRWVKSDAGGNYLISNLAYGTYKLYADVPGIECTPVIFTLSPDAPAATITLILNGTTSIESVDEPGFELYPNPASETASMKIDLKKSGNVSLSLTNLAGQTISTTSVNTGSGLQTIQLPLHGVAAGTYLVSVRNEQNNLIGVRRLTVTK